MKKTIEASIHAMDLLVRLPDGAVLKLIRSGLLFPWVFLLDNGPQFPAADLTAGRF